MPVLLPISIYIAPVVKQKKQKSLDLEEKDERTIAEVLNDMQAEADGIAEAVAQLKQLLGGLEI